MKVSYSCLNCKHHFKVEYTGWYPQKECPKCKATARYTELQGSTLFVKKYKDVTGFGYDKKTGQPMWVDRKGRKIRHDDAGVRYNLDKDPHGWRSSGQKVREGAD